MTSALAAAGAPRTLVAFLLVFARHASGVREEAARAFRALALRGFEGRLPPLPQFDPAGQAPHLATATALLAVGLWEVLSCIL